VTVSSPGAEGVAPAGCTVRALVLEDAALIAELASEDERSFGVDAAVGAKDVAEWWTRTDLARNSWLVEREGSPAAFGWLEPYGQTLVAVGAVLPGWKEQGLGSWLVDRSEERVRTLQPTRIHQLALGPDAAAHALFRSRGYGEVRRHWEMVIDLDEEPPEPSLPEGFRIATFDPAEARAFHAASQEAFAEEWGFRALPFDEWWEMRTKAPGYDPSLWFVIRDGGELAAVCRCVDGLRGGGHVGMLGVRKQWRRRGFGLALLLHAFRDFRRRDAPHVSLGVDSENPTGATRLYEKAGMRVEREYVTFEKELP
jgi:mycothiol synthase